MARSSTVRTIFSSAGIPALAVTVIGFFGYIAVLGPNGVLAYQDVRQQVAEKSARFNDLDKRRAEIRNRVDLLDQKRGADPDLVEELARKRLNVAHPEDLIVLDEAK
ncbi:septum formation initiator family protein [Sphingomonas canadensis]|uniref:Septum formation initiator family protein n=1 Tax=Sphingomonas canadensis TaxID=1219257 RepID=A0ABW3H776_9SPHN|nr:septum formation initiator family protein [Sphingomonas canadensis]MCW3836858.1 septum formation initiator family protein [Sphingomonas canadensis]